MNKMGPGEEIKTRNDPETQIQERGEIYFFYRPKVGKEEAHGAEDVQRLYMVLRPESGEKSLEDKQDPHSGNNIKEAAGGKKNKHDAEGGRGSQKVDIEKESLLRYIIMGRQSFPDTTKRGRGRPYWGFVDMVTTKVDDIKNAFKGEEYETSTRGHRHVGPARALAEGIYRILRHKSGTGSGKRSSNKNHTHLIYKLELPTDDERNEAQQSLNIEREASFLIQIKNPEQQSGGGFGGLGNKRKAVFPAHLQGLLGNLRFGPADPPDFLNYEGCEFLLISASDDIEEELGLELHVESQDDKSCSDLVQLFGDAAISNPLLKGTWE